MIQIKIPSYSSLDVLTTACILEHVWRNAEGGCVVVETDTHMDSPLTDMIITMPYNCRALLADYMGETLTYVDTGPSSLYIEAYRRRGVTRLLDSLGMQAYAINDTLPRGLFQLYWAQTCTVGNDKTAALLGYACSVNRNIRNWRLISVLNQHGLDQACSKGEVAVRLWKALGVDRKTILAT